MNSLDWNTRPTIDLRHGAELAPTARHEKFAQLTKVRPTYYAAPREFWFDRYALSLSCVIGGLALGLVGFLAGVSL